MSADTIAFPNNRMRLQAIEHLAAAEDFCGTNECAAEFETIRKAIYRQIKKAHRTDANSEGIVLASLGIGIGGC